MYKYIFNNVKKLIPKISETELIALRSGTTSIDRDIFNGFVNTNFKFKKYDEFKFNDSLIDEIHNKYKNDIVYPNNNNNEIINFLGKKQIFFVYNK